jgi:hypothetical protein
VIDGGSLRLPTLIQRPAPFQTIIALLLGSRPVKGGLISPPTPESETIMPHAIIRGANGRCHEVDFGDAPVRVEIYASEETVEIFIEADFDMLPEERRRFAILNIPRHLFSEATAAVARRATNPRLHPRRDK